MKLRLLSALCLTIALTILHSASAKDDLQKLVVIAGKPSHPPRMHEFQCRRAAARQMPQKTFPGLQV